VSWRAGGKRRPRFYRRPTWTTCAPSCARCRAEPLLFVGLGSNLLVRDGGFAAR
jgi:UDP-N-acetylmuramate dehydrogenase